MRHCAHFNAGRENVFVETVVASGETEEELLASAREYNRLCGMTGGNNLKERFSRRMRCRRCKGVMRYGIAIQSTFCGIPDFPGGRVVTLSHGGPGRLINVLKCHECGWSVSHEQRANH